ncbi:MAG TPA: short-chain dehydrogenase/reductase [Thermoleophilaceae bacterium]|jgi:NAD(P)-dependent dehydrogenase (short-subunit alcohol dehydrogenase family)
MARASYPLAGRTVLITGAARGIGAATARRLAAGGARVALLGLEPELLREVAADCGDAPWFEVDVRDRAALEGAVDATVERLGGIDVCIANAGIAPTNLVRLTDPEAIDRVIDVNLTGSCRTLRLCLPHVLERRGYLLAVASAAAILHPPALAPYAATKAGIEAFCDSLRVEVAHSGVGVGVAYFGWIDTELVRGGDERAAFRDLRGALKGPLGRTYPASDAAEAIARGVERRARWVTAPGLLRALLFARGVLQPIGDRETIRRMAAVDRLAEAEAERIGDRASQPVGEGGRAAVEAAADRPAPG